MTTTAILAARDVLDDLMASTQFYTDHARSFQDEVAAMLTGAGWLVRREVPVESRGDGRRGRIDLVATKDGDVVAIELDCRSARSKSLHKLESFRDATARMILLRGDSFGVRWMGRILVCSLRTRGSS